MNRSIDEALARLNDAQRRAAAHDDRPLLIVAGAGTGKTTTLAHRVAWLIATGTPPGRILLLTFARRAAAEMLRRVESLVGESASQVWGGTFHAVAARLMRLHARSVGLDPSFTILDRGDGEDLMHVVRSECGLDQSATRFPRKETCMAIYSRAVNSGSQLEPLIGEAYPWCRPHIDDLKRLFTAYADRKAAANTVDYDDLLVFFRALASDAAVRGRFDRILVDEYQDTNALQAEILRGLSPSGRGLTVVGDDAQAIYSFRAATVRNILDFPRQYPGTAIVALEQNYRATPSIVAASNVVIAEAAERHDKTLFSCRRDGDPPSIVTCADEDEQSRWIVDRVLERREEGILLRRQAVLFRASANSAMLELELSRRRIPFHKFGGLKFIEAAHIKDATAFLRLLENPGDLVAGMRLLQLLPGIGPRKARALMDAASSSANWLDVWRATKPPSQDWPRLLDLLQGIARNPSLPPATQLELVRHFYTPILEDKYDDAAMRLRDLEQLEHIAARFADRSSFLANLALDPPASTSDLAGPPVIDEDWLVLSTIHSAKGLEWDCVYVISAADGNIPSDMATRRAEEIEEERRLFYVALTRAKNWLAVLFPLCFYRSPIGSGSRSDTYSFAQLTRFLTPAARAKFLHVAAAPPRSVTVDAPAPAYAPAVDPRSALRAMWALGRRA